MEDRKTADIRLICKEDCGNAPRKELLRDITLAFAGGDTEFLLKHVADSIVWEIAGNTTLVGQAAFADAVRRLHAFPPVELHIRHIITHGRTGAVSGTVRHGGGSGRAFCDVYEFTGASKTAKIKAITSYIIELPDHA